MYDAQFELYKIIMNIDQRLKKVKDLKAEIRSEQPDPQKLAGLYFTLLRLSSRILTEIRTLKQIEKTMERPFMFNGVQYDGDHMHLQLKRKRC